MLWMISGLHCAPVSSAALLSCRMPLWVFSFLFFSVKVQCASCILRCCKWTGKHISKGPIYFQSPEWKREVSAIVLLLLKTLGWFIVNERNRKTSAQTTCRIKACVPFWDRIFLREGHNTSFLQHGTRSNKGYCTGLNNTQGVSQTVGETCPLWEKVILWEPQQLHTVLWHE